VCDIETSRMGASYIYIYIYIYIYDFSHLRVNQEVRQGCPLSPILFHVCLDEIRVKTGSFKQETQEE